MTRRSKPPLSPQDAALWERYARSVQPLPGRRPVVARAAATDRKASAPGDSASSTTSGVARSVKVVRPARAVHSSTNGVAGANAQALAAHQHREALRQGGTLDKRTRQRLVRGQVRIEARLDLHGCGVEEAHMRLRAFIAQARRQGLRTVLVITGKGGNSALARHTLHGYAYHHAPERSGRLRQLLPQWLSDVELAEHVAGWQPAHPRHGGGGAFYVRLRRLSR